MGGHKFEDMTAAHLGLSKEEFQRWNKKARDIFCRDYILALLKEYKNANRVSKVIDMTNRALYSVMQRYGVAKLKRQYRAKKRVLKHGK